MSNITERLRHWSKPDKFGNREGRADDFAEAANEIERLRAEALQAEQNWAADWKREVEKLEDRIAELRAALANVHEELLGTPGEAAETARAMIKALAKEEKP